MRTRSITFRRIGAVLAGLVAIFVVTTAIDIALHVTGVFPPLGERPSDPLFVLATIYRIVIAVAGCYLAARLAPDRPMQHALMLGAIGVVLSTAGAIATWNTGIGPNWYPLGLIAISMPCAWLGGRLHAARAGKLAVAGGLEPPN